MPMPEPFEGWTKQDFINEIDRLQRMNYSLYKDIKHIESDYQLQNNQVLPKPANERGAGRKPILSDNSIKLIKLYREKGESIRTIARWLNISVGTVHKVISS